MMCGGLVQGRHTITFTFWSEACRFLANREDRVSLKIAQHFNAGLRRVVQGKSLHGPKKLPAASVGTFLCVIADPSAKALGYFRLTIKY